MNNLHNILNILIASRSKLSNAELIMLLDEINRQLKDNIIRKHKGAWKNVQRVK